jgi:hypothetical protein
LPEESFMKRKHRLSIATLMGVVLIAALVLAALRHPGETWGGVFLLLTGAVLMLAVVGAVCRRGNERAWWLGFALFGWGYFALVFAPPQERLFGGLPTSAVLRLLWPKLGGANVMGGAGGFQSVPLFVQFGGMGIASFPSDSYWRIGHCLWSLLAGLLGGTLARLLFANSLDRQEEPLTEPPLSVGAPRTWGRGPVAIAGGGLALFAVFTLRTLPRAPGLWAGGTYLLSWTLVGLAGLGALMGRGKRRVPWLGAALFGAGTMILILRPAAERQTSPQRAAHHVLNSVRSHLPTALAQFPASSKNVAAANARIWNALEQPVPMRFPDVTPVEDVLKYVEQNTALPDGGRLRIYVDPNGLMDAEKTMTSPVEINLEGVPLKTTLWLALQQLGLIYSVREGVLLITSPYSDNPIQGSWIDEDPFLLAGDSVLALLAAGLGAILAPLVYREAG